MPSDHGRGEGNRVKIKIIKNCEECEHHYPINDSKGDITFYMCIYGEVKMCKKLDDYPNIPSWCQLKDYKEAEHEELT